MSIERLMTDDVTRKISKAERLIADGIHTACPLCTQRLVIGDKQVGESGAQAVQYQCTNKDCIVGVGVAHIPAGQVVLRLLAGRAVKGAMYAIGFAAIITLAVWLCGMTAGPMAVLSVIIDVRGERQWVDDYLSRLEENAPNEYARAEFKEIKRRHDEMTEESHLFYEKGPENVYVMARLADKTKGAIDGISAFTGTGWGSELDPYYQANRRALDRNVEIRRVFIIPEEYSDKPQELDRLIDVMTRQQIAGIDVYYVRQNDLPLIPFYAERGYYSCGKFDDIFSWEVRPRIGNRFPEQICTTWEPEEIRKYSPFPGIYASPHVHLFDRNTSPGKIKLLLTGN